MQCFQGFTEKLINTAFVKIVFAGFDSPQVHPEKLDFIGLFSFAPVKINGQTRWL